MLQWAPLDLFSEKQNPTEESMSPEIETPVAEMSIEERKKRKRLMKEKEKISGE